MPPKLPMCYFGAVLQGSGAARNGPYPRRNLGCAFEIGTAKFGHPIEYADANFGFRFLVFEGASF